MWANEAATYGRCAVLLGSLMQLERLHQTVRVSYSRPVAGIVQPSTRHTRLRSVHRRCPFECFAGHERDASAAMTCVHYERKKEALSGTFILRKCHRNLLATYETMTVAMSDELS